MKRRLFVASAACSLAGPTHAIADAYPSRPINLVVPFPAGGGGDLHARFLTQRLAGEWGPWIVVNKAGGAGIPAAETVKRAAPDGYTLLQGHVGMLSINPALYPKLSYDPAQDFAPVTMLFQLGTVIAVNATSPLTTLAGLVDMAGSRSEGLTYASVGVGTGTHLLGERMRLNTRTHMIHVPFQGSAPALQNLLAGRVDFAIDGVANVKPLVDAGKLRVLAIASDKRHALLPNVPTTADAGFKGLESDFWVGLFAPRHTPPTIISKLNEAVRNASRTPAFLAEMEARGYEVVTSTASELGDRVAHDTDMLGRIIRTAGIHI